MNQDNEEYLDSEPDFTIDERDVTQSKNLDSTTDQREVIQPTKGRLCNRPKGGYNKNNSNKKDNNNKNIKEKIYKKEKTQSSPNNKKRFWSPIKN